MQTKRYNAGKPRMSLVPPEAIFAAARGFTYGSGKYDPPPREGESFQRLEDNNWRQTGFPYSSIVDSLQRHLGAFMLGEDTDEESGLCHLDLAMCNLSMLVEHHANRPHLDDRFRHDRPDEGLRGHQAGDGARQMEGVRLSDFAS